MPRLVRDVDADRAPRAPALREELLQRYRARAAQEWPPLVPGWPPLRDDRAARIARDLEEGRAVVLPGWELRPLVPTLPQGHRFFDVDRVGAVVEVAARCDPLDPMSIVGWDPVSPVATTRRRRARA